MLNLSNNIISYSPFPISIIKNVFEEKTLNTLISTFPKTSEMNIALDKKNYGQRYYLSKQDDKKNKDHKFKNFIFKNQAWEKLLSYIYSEEFIKKILSYWSEKNCDVGIG